MSLDERPAKWQHMDLRDRWDDDQAGVDAGSEEAEAAMFAEAMTQLRRTQPWRFTDPGPDDTADRRLFGWREEERFEQAGWPEDAA